MIKITPQGSKEAYDLYQDVLGLVAEHLSKTVSEDPQVPVLALMSAQYALIIKLNKEFPNVFGPHWQIAMSKLAAGLASNEVVSMENEALQASVASVKDRLDELVKKAQKDFSTED